MSDKPDWLDKYEKRGFKLVFYETKTKIPRDPSWNKKDYKSEYKEGQNVGVILGIEFETGKFLTDIDLDWGPGVDLSGGILPHTKFAFGHPPSKPFSHAFFATPEPIEYKKYNNIQYHEKDKTEYKAKSLQCFVEIRGSLTAEENPAQQTMIPPSIWAPINPKTEKPDLSHPGEKLEFYKTSNIESEISYVDDLPRCTTIYAIACLLHANIPKGAFKHEMRLACAGFLLGDCELTREETTAVMHNIFEQNGPHDKGDDVSAIKTTLERVKRGIAYKRRSKFIELLDECYGEFSYGGKVTTQIIEWLGGNSFIVGDKGQIIPNHQENVKRALDKIGVDLSFDVFSQKPMVRYSNPHLNGHSYHGPLVDTIVRQAWLEIDERYHFRASKDFFYDVTENVANKNTFHPVLDYLQSLEWDGEPRLDEWLIKSGKAADTEYIRAVSSIMLIAAVRRVTEPGCKYDEMLVLESPQQGLMKSTALRTMCPNGKWFSDDLPLNVDAKQIVERTLGKWIIEASDLSGMRRSQIEHLKGMLSRQTDGPVRPAYGRLPIEQPRQFIIVGTTNSSTYLTDSTGNRRFWPVRVKQFDIEWLKENRDQIWAEAAHREEQKESIRLDPKLYAHATMQQERRRAEDPWEAKFDEEFTRDKKWRLTPDEVWGVIGIPIERRDPVSNDRVLNAMNHLGFRRVTVRGEDGKAVKGFGRDVEEGQLGLDGEEE